MNKDNNNQNALLGSQGRAPWATLWENSKGRYYPEEASETRTPFQRDRDRIIHSAAFRRLMHKTQVFVSPTKDHIRTRLTHSLEVAQIARSLSRSLRLDEDLTEALALSHDLGHPPFGHSGEDALNEVMEPFGGYDHNDQALRIVVKLEHRYPGHPGLNLCWETLEGLTKHNGPLIGSGPKAVASESALPVTIRSYSQEHDLRLRDFAGLEAQVAAIADDIAYNHHDMDDGLRAHLFLEEEVSAAVPHVAEVFSAVRQDFPDADESIRIAEVVRRLIGEMVADVYAETNKRLQELAPSGVEDIRTASRSMVAFSPEMASKEAVLKSFLYARMYRNEAVNQERDEGQEIIRNLFDGFMKKPQLLPSIWRQAAAAANAPDRARIVADYIAGMTDRYAKRERDHIAEFRTAREKP